MRDRLRARLCSGKLDQALAGAAPARAGGVARTLVLLRDGTSPLYDERRSRELVASLNAALDDLDL